MLVISLAPGADPKPVIAELDRLLEPYGSAGAIERRDQPSNRFLEDELNQQKVMSITIPYHLFRGRCIPAQCRARPPGGSAARADRRAQGARISRRRPRAALPQAVAVIVLVGSALGVAGGVCFGRAMIASYHGFFRLPDLAFELTPWSVIVGAGDQFRRRIAWRHHRACEGCHIGTRGRYASCRADGLSPFMAGKLMSTRRLAPRNVMMLRNIAGRPLRARPSPSSVSPSRCRWSCSACFGAMRSTR